jgi:predicted DNA-binding transcriptional regulator AlpA
MKGRSNRAAVAPEPQAQGTTPTPNTPPPANALPLQSPRLLTKQEAASYCGITRDTFDDYRLRGIVPGPIFGTNRWDKKKIDLWLDTASGIASQTTSSLDEWRTRRDG